MDPLFGVSGAGTVDGRRGKRPGPFAMVPQIPTTDLSWGSDRAAFWRLGCRGTDGESIGYESAMPEVKPLERAPLVLARLQGDIDAALRPVRGVWIDAELYEREQVLARGVQEQFLGLAARGCARDDGRDFLQTRLDPPVVDRLIDRRE